MKTISLILSVLLITPKGLSAALTRIGAAAAVSGRVMATAPKAAASRIIKSGKTVWHMDKVSTGAKGRLQIMLLDETVFTIGPKTELILDEFVYDPVTDTGKISARITKGVFRFVTGKIARKEPSKMKIKLPMGTIGIRGTIAAGAILPDGTEMIALLAPGPNNAAGERPGAIDVTSEGVTRSITSPGFGVLVKKGEGVSKVMKLSKEQLSKLEVAPPAESDKGDGSDPSGGKSAKEESGEGDDSAQGDLTETASAGNIASAFSDLTNDAADDIATGSASDVTQWDAMRALSGGSAYYEATGSFTCSGGSGGCSEGGSGFWDLHFYIDFNSKILGGCGASCHVGFQSGDLGSGGTLSSEIPPINFSALQGDATLTFGTDFTGTNADFDGTTFSFKNGGSETHTNLVFTGTGISDGLLTGSSGATTTAATLVSPCISNCPSF